MKGEVKFSAHGLNPHPGKPKWERMVGNGRGSKISGPGSAIMMASNEDTYRRSRVAERAVQPDA